MRRCENHGHMAKALWDAHQRGAKAADAELDAVCRELDEESAEERDRIAREEAQIAVMRRSIPAGV